MIHGSTNIKFRNETMHTLQHGTEGTHIIYS